MKFRNKEQGIVFLAIRGLIVTALVLALLAVLGRTGVIVRGQDTPAWLVEETMGTIQGPSVE